MPRCSFTHVFCSTKKKRRNLQHPSPVHIRARSVDDVDTTRSAILSCDTATDSNVISHRLVTKVLGEQYHPIDKEGALPVQTELYGEQIDGYVDLDWCWERNTGKWHNTRFLVTTMYNPPYDAVLGRKDAEYYGLIRAKKRR